MFPKTYVGISIDEPNQLISVASFSLDKEDAKRNAEERVPGVPVIVITIGDPPAVVRSECFKFFEGLNIPQKEWENTFQEVVGGIQELLDSSKPKV